MTELWRCVLTSLVLVFGVFISLGENMQHEIRLQVIRSSTIMVRGGKQQRSFRKVVAERENVELVVHILT